MASISTSSGRLKLSKPSSAKGVPFSRNKARAPPPIAVISCTNLLRVGGVFKYSITSGSTPLARIIANVLRDVPQAGLW